MDAVVLSTLIVQVIDFLRETAEAIRTKTPGRWSGPVTQLLAWLGGVAVIAFAAAANATETLVLPGTTMALGELDGASQVLVGLLVASFGSTIADVKTAIDSSDSAKTPPLLRG